MQKRSAKREREGARESAEILAAKKGETKGERDVWRDEAPPAAAVKFRGEAKAQRDASRFYE